MGKVLGFGKIRSKGQFTLGKNVLDVLDVKPGDTLLVLHEDGQIVLKRGNAEVQVK